MARITCAISGIRFNCSFLDSLSIPHTAGYYHPIFALTYTDLHNLYSKHCKGELTTNDSYLLFLAFLNSSDQVIWEHPVALNPNDQRTKQLIENNMAQLIQILEKSGIISHPSFKQPSFKVTREGATLSQIPIWIEAWQDNVDDFYLGRATLKEREDLQSVENRLSNLILSGESPEKFSHVIASWASKAGDFPELKDDLWQKTIRSCFSITKMFNTPLALLKEIKDHCECNIDVGSIHFHTLSEVLKEGIKRHVDYLGGSSLALGYTLLDSPLIGTTTIGGKEREAKNDAELLALAAKAPEKVPVKEDYDDSLSFLKARLAYRVRKNIAPSCANAATKMSDTIEEESNDG